MIDLSPKPIPPVTREDVERGHRERAIAAREARIEGRRQADDRDALIVAFNAACEAYRRTYRKQGGRGTPPPLVIGTPLPLDDDPCGGLS